MARRRRTWHHGTMKRRAMLGTSGAGADKARTIPAGMSRA